MTENNQNMVDRVQKGKDSSTAQGKRRYDRNQSEYGGQTRPIFHNKIDTRDKKDTSGSGCAEALKKLENKVVVVLEKDGDIDDGKKEDG
ncbi:60S ribosomal protein L44 [Tanacetum coccineum]